MSEKNQYLTPDQVQQLNEKHGWFQYGDAQSDVSKAFAQDAIAMHERMRAAAPDLLAALQKLVEAAEGFSVSGVYFNEFQEHSEVLQAAYAAVDKATGSQA